MGAKAPGFKLHTNKPHNLTASPLFISTQIPCFLNWDFPPILCNKPNSDAFPSLHLKWGFSLFLKRVTRLGLPETSWRSKCPYSQPPPLILSKGVDEAEWGDVQKKGYVTKRLRRKRLGSDVNPLIPILVPDFGSRFLLVLSAVVQSISS